MLTAKHHLLSSLVIAALLMVSPLVIPVVQAQSVVETPVASSSSSQSVIVTRDSLAGDLAEVRRTYRGQLEEYRKLHQQFIVAQKEFEQLNTLSSLEKAVQATREVMVMRDQVLQTYLKILELEVRSAEGVEVKLKEPALVFLEDTAKMITRHQGDTQISTNRDAVATRADEFEEIVEVYDFTTSFVREVLQLSKIRAVQDKAHAVLYELPVELPGNSQIANDQRLRALEQIDQRIKDVDVILDELQLNLEEAAVSGRAGRSSADDINDAYVGMAQVMNFLIEVTNAATL